jgi:hypothetical protein
LLELIGINLAVPSRSDPRVRDFNPEELGSQYREIRTRHPQITVLGGCCGTDHRHIEQIRRSGGFASYGFPRSCLLLLAIKSMAHASVVHEGPRWRERQGVRYAVKPPV